MLIPRQRLDCLHDRHIKPGKMKTLVLIMLGFLVILGFIATEKCEKKNMKLAYDQGYSDGYQVRMKKGADLMETLKDDRNMDRFRRGELHNLER